MPIVRVTGGWLRVRGRGHPDNSLPDGGDGGDEAPDQGLPEEQPGIDNELPSPPPGIWPPPTISHPIVPIPPHVWPRPPVKPDNTLPGSQPGVDNTLPGSQPGIDNTLPGSQPGIDNTLPAPPGTIWPPSPGAPSGSFWVVVWIPGYGYRYVVVDPSLKPDNSLPRPPARPDQGLPGSQPGVDNTLPTPPAQPKS